MEDNNYDSMTISKQQSRLSPRY